MKLHELAKKFNVKSTEVRNWLEEEHNIKLAIQSKVDANVMELVSGKFMSEEEKKNRKEYPAFGLYQKEDKSWCVVEFSFNSLDNNAKFVKIHDDDGQLKYKSAAVFVLENVINDSSIYTDE